MSLRHRLANLAQVAQIAKTSGQGRGCHAPCAQALTRVVTVAAAATGLPKQP